MINAVSVQCEVHRFERIQKFSDPPLDVCPVCGKGRSRKLLSSPAIQFKGTGWYITDYAKKSSTDAGKPRSGSRATAESTKSEVRQRESEQARTRDQER